MVFNMEWKSNNLCLEYFLIGLPSDNSSILLTINQLLFMINRKKTYWLFVTFCRLWKKSAECDVKEPHLAPELQVASRTLEVFRKYSGRKSNLFLLKDWKLKMGQKNQIMKPQFLRLHDLLHSNDGRQTFPQHHKSSAVLRCYSTYGWND